MSNILPAGELEASPLDPPKVDFVAGVDHVVQDTVSSTEELKGWLDQPEQRSLVVQHLFRRQQPDDSAGGCLSDAKHEQNIVVLVERCVALTLQPVLEDDRWVEWAVTGFNFGQIFWAEIRRKSNTILFSGTAEERHGSLPRCYVGEADPVVNPQDLHRKVGI